MEESSSRWIEVTPSRFQHEHEGLEHVREHLPDEDPYCAWTNFEVVVRGGAWGPSRCHEVDLLVLAPRGFYLVELKGWRGPVRKGLPGLWEAGPGHNEPDPFKATSLKAKELASALKRRSKGSGLVIPHIEPAVFLSNPGVQCELVADRRINIFGQEGPAAGGRLPGIVSGLLTRPAPRNAITPDEATELIRLLNMLDIRQRRRRINAYVLAPDLFAESRDWREFLATHEEFRHMHARVRLYHTGWTEAGEVRRRLNNAARREFLLKERLSHPAIVTPMDFTSVDEGPALIYPYDPDARRLDAILNADPQLSSQVALRIIKGIAEAVKHAHDREVTHGGLSPRAVFVTPGKEPVVRVVDWLTASASTETGTPFRKVLAGTEHPTALLAEDMQPYRAPETLTNRNFDGKRADMFSLGAIAYRLLGGELPSDLAQLHTQLARDQGLRLDESTVSTDLRELVFHATRPTVSDRLDNAMDFLHVGSWTHPADAGPGTELANRWQVLRRLGSGSSAYALLVADVTSGERRVMKIARSAEHNDLLAREAETLSCLHHQGIIRLVDGPITVNGCTALVTEHAGEQTLAENLQEAGRLRGETLRAWGEELLATAAFLDEKGITHRDIKPANLVVRPESARGGPRLVLFDFSHSSMPATAIRTGTSGYLDPFLGSPQRPTWDSAAENWAVAVTLFEMATGTVPKFGDGESHPPAVTFEATVTPAMFALESGDPTIEVRLAEFFRRALRRDAAKRFPDIRAMRAAWHGVFAPAPQVVSSLTIDQRLARLVMEQAVGKEVVARDIPHVSVDPAPGSGSSPRVNVLIAALVTLFILGIVIVASVLI